MGGNVESGAGSRDPAPEAEREQPNRVTVIASLTRRQREALSYLLKGLSNKDIGDEMGISERTVEHHLAPVFRLLHVRTRMALAALLRSFQK